MMDKPEPCFRIEFHQDRDSRITPALRIRETLFVIRAVNGYVAAYAGCGRVGNVRRVNPRIGGCCRRQVTLQADGVDVG